MGHENNTILGHGADNDGIEEFDNPMPTWWLGLFYVTIVWAVIYAAHYHGVGGRSQTGEYDAEMAAALAAQPAAPAVVATGSTAAAGAGGGKGVYTSNCIACHGPELKGGIGPDLTDATWIHGGSLADIERTITVGVPEKGMITWGPILGPQKIAQVAVFIHDAGGGL